ncbi:hypothetical protein CEXT_132941 [Caerostris extrusa]|uniref:Uncharacterized protein n=1 Tax=Caerostris extrusa TaxID=172846 RepID=A0AAV4NRQ6_CAEEX|nr:hypothetical protein CEXT_132941 [Caerostris extrusa]
MQHQVFITRRVQNEMPLSSSRGHQVPEPLLSAYCLEGVDKQHFLFEGASYRYRYLPSEISSREIRTFELSFDIHLNS